MIQELFTQKYLFSESTFHLHNLSPKYCTYTRYPPISCSVFQVVIYQKVSPLKLCMQSLTLNPNNIYDIYWLQNSR